MNGAIKATGLEQVECVCLLQLETQMVRQQGYISRPAFKGALDDVFTQWEQQGHIQLDTKKLAHLDKETIRKKKLTHSCKMSEDLWLAVGCLRRIYAHDL